MIAFSWDKRIQRAEQLSGEQPASAELLRFYAHVARFQKGVYEGLRPEWSGWLGTASVAPYFPPFLRLIQGIGPPVAAERALQLERDNTSFEDAMALAWDGENEIDHAPGEAVFFARALLQPYLECLVVRNALRAVERNPAALDEARCPCCGGKPGLAVLRTEGGGAKRSLECSWCSNEWEFRRVVCPGCSEERNDRLPVYVAAEFEYVRVEACDTCRAYLKSIDLTKNGLAVPCVDEVATVSLDCWAQENGYNKIAINAVGM
jgi:FdhE protein